MDDPRVVELRRALDRLDGELVRLLGERAALVAQVAARKQAVGLAERDPARERWLLRRLARLAAARGVDPALVRHVYGVILHDSVARQRGELHRVVFQGGRGAFSELAAVRLFPGDGHGISGVASFADAVDAVREGRADAAVLPVHNTVIGEITGVTRRTAAAGLAAGRTLAVRVELCVLGVADVPASALREVRSQREALRQCGGWLARHPGCAPVEADDTARAAAGVLAAGDPAVAAIAGPQAASLLGLRVLARDVADQPDVHTTFAVFTAPPTGGR